MKDSFLDEFRRLLSSYALMAFLSLTPKQDREVIEAIGQVTAAAMRVGRQPRRTQAR